ncbi:MAG: response regulator [Deltaproteobacteria bacterium]|nr:response regulator [Deltaproteobacteria bacterium]
MTDKLQGLGRLLVDRGVLDQAAVDTALAQPEASEARFLSRLLQQGLANEFDLVSILAEHFGMPGVDLSQSAFLLDVLDLVPRPVAEGDQMLPLSTEGGRLHVAVAAPGDSESTADEVRFITGMEVSLYVGLTEPLRAAIAQSYDMREKGGTIWVGPGLNPQSDPGLCIIEPLGPPIVEDAEPIEDEATLPSATRPEALERALAAQAAQARSNEAVIDLAPVTTKPTTGKIQPLPPKAEPKPLELSIEPAPVSRPPSSPAIPQIKKTEPPPPKTTPISLDPKVKAPIIDIEIGDDEEEEEVLESVRVGPKRILVVDDEADIVRLCLRALQSKGYLVDSASDGAIAEKMLQTKDPYDLVLLDAMLPQVHGFEICQRIKASPKLRTAQVVMMSAVYRGWRFAQDAHETYGADDYLEKPFHLAELLRRVEERLAQGKAAQPAKKEVEALYKEGLIFFEDKKLPEARAKLEAALKEDPFSPKAHFALARVLAAQGDGYRAITSYERAIELRPNLFPALRNLAQLYLTKGFRRKAAETFERALQSAPDPQTRESLRTSLLRLL